jgi:hypothetical protein
VARQPSDLKGRGEPWRHCFGPVGQPGQALRRSDGTSGVARCRPFDFDRSDSSLYRDCAARSGRSLRARRTVHTRGPCSSNPRAPRSPSTRSTLNRTARCATEDAHPSAPPGSVDDILEGRRICSVAGAMPVNPCTNRLRAMPGLTEQTVRRSPMGSLTPGSGTRADRRRGLAHGRDRSILRRQENRPPTRDPAWRVALGSGAAQLA